MGSTLPSCTGTRNQPSLPIAVTGCDLNAHQDLFVVDRNQPRPSTDSTASFCAHLYHRHNQALFS